MIKNMQFSLPEIPVKIRLGITEEERATPQEIFITLLWQADTNAVEKSDNIEDTIDYFQVREWIIKWGKSSTFATIEKCIHTLSKDIQKQFPKMNDIHLSLTKIPEGEFAVVVEI